MSDLGAYAHRLDNAQAAVCEAASTYCFDPTPEGMTALRHAVAEWRSSVGLWKLAVSQASNQHSVELQEQLEVTRRDVARAVYLAQHLHQMIDPQVWRDSGGDDGQGHYEGEARAWRVLDELDEIAKRVNNE